MLLQNCQSKDSNCKILIVRLSLTPSQTEQRPKITRLCKRLEGLAEREYFHSCYDYIYDQHKLEHNHFSNIRRNYHTSRMRPGKRNQISGFKPNTEASHTVSEEHRERYMTPWMAMYNTYLGLGLSPHLRQAPDKTELLLMPRLSFLLPSQDQS